MKKLIIPNKIKASLLAFASALSGTGAIAAHKFRSGEANDSAYAFLFCIALAVFCGYNSYTLFRKA